MVLTLPVQATDTDAAFAVTYRTAMPIHNLEFGGVVQALTAKLTSKSYLRICYYPHDADIEAIGDYEGNALATIEKFQSELGNCLTRLSGEDYIVLHTPNGRITVRLA